MKLEATRIKKPNLASTENCSFYGIHVIALSLGSMNMKFVYLEKQLNETLGRRMAGLVSVSGKQCKWMMMVLELSSGLAGHNVGMDQKDQLKLS